MGHGVIDLSLFDLQTFDVRGRTGSVDGALDRSMKVCI